MYRLHGFSQSGNTYKVALLLQALDQPWQAQHVDFMNGVTRTDEWREASNEMGEVPILDDGSQRLTQSGVILTWLAESDYPLAGRYPNILSWLERMRALPGWKDPYEILPGERIASKW